MDTLHYVLIGLAIILLTGLIYIGYKNYKISNELSSLQYRYNALKTQIEHGVIVDEGCPVIRNQPKYSSTIHIPSEPSDFSLEDTQSARGNDNEHIIQPDEHELSQQQAKSSTGGLFAMQNILTNTISNNYDPNQDYTNSYNDHIEEKSVEDYDHINIDQANNNDTDNIYSHTLDENDNNNPEDDNNDPEDEDDNNDPEDENNLEYENDSEDNSGDNIENDSGNNIENDSGDNISLEENDDNILDQNTSILISSEKPILSSTKLEESVNSELIEENNDDISNQNIINNSALPQSLVPEINLMPDIDIPDEVFQNHNEMDNIKSVAASGTRLNLDNINITPKKTVIIKKKVN